MSELHEILFAPHITEESTKNMVDARKDVHKYVFKVAMKATKDEIKAAIEKRFDVKVASVNTLINRGKIKRVRLAYGKKPNWKRPISHLRPGKRLPSSKEYNHGSEILSPAYPDSALQADW